MRTLLKYAKMRQIAKYAAIAYLCFSDMPVQYMAANVTRQQYMFVVRCLLMFQLLLLSTDLATLCFSDFCNDRNSQ